MTRQSGIEYLPLPGWNEAGEHSWTLAEIDYSASVNFQIKSPSPETRWEWKITINNGTYRNMGWESSPREAMEAALKAAKERLHGKVGT